MRAPCGTGTTDPFLVLYVTGHRPGFVDPARLVDADENDTFISIHHGGRGPAGAVGGAGCGGRSGLLLDHFYAHRNFDVAFNL